MDYTEQFIRLNCSLMSDYKMMKLNADMKCMGLGLYLETILFLRKQQEYKHDFNELDLLADQWGATVENLQHLIKDFDLFLITEDGYFRCLYLDEVMGYQSKLSEQRAAAGSKGGRSSKKSTVKASAKATASTASAIGRGRINEGKNGDTSCVDNNGEAYMKSDDTPCVYDNGEAYLKSDDTPCMDNNGEVYMKSGDAFCVDNNGEAYMESSGVPCMDNNKEVYLKSSGAPSMDSKERIYMESRNVDSNKTVCMESSKPIHSDYNKEIYKENSTESNVKSSAESMKNTTAKNTNENSVKNVIQSVDNECYGKNLQASFKQSFIREEKNRGEKKKKDDVDIIETNGSIDDDMKFCSGKKSGEMLRWECYINEAFKVQSWVEIVGMMSGLKGDFLNNLPFIRSMFKKHVVVQGSTERITSVSEAQAYFANYIRPGKPTRLFLEEKLKERSRMQNESTSLSPYETYNPLTGERSYCGVPLPADAPPRPNGRATWDNLKQSWI
ncbi:DUF4373 domain-containing protein [Phocaeicola vulgatus]|jgi:hypothetical protein|uniref:DUF7833 domain-containing protein n=1 Tax=Phocaeicola vulgatus dnLKV7 TaxID=1235786 RepID=R9HK29_PHOVU|nr:DUF4373 domain-containing protein [Phocaeicola vulgatus]EOS04377.1 hypothetical protein C800_01375 [Phocaeicola vulgatus dnLKV7]KAB5420819.1 DUF4373 domain-containing protein [Phocaeicola vulgatus]